MHNHGYAHYEISNFCRPPHFSQHNTSYWQGKEYLGIGPAAHSFDGRVRQWNVANNAQYIKAIDNNHIPCEKEVLTPTQQVNEYIMTSLRTMWGTNLQKIANLCGEQGKKNIVDKAQKFVHNKTLIIDNDTMFLSHSGRMIADYITLELFMEN